MFGVTFKLPGVTAPAVLAPTFTLEPLQGISFTTAS